MALTGLVFALLSLFVMFSPIEAQDAPAADSGPYAPRSVSRLLDLGFTDLRAVGERPTLEVFFPGRGDFDLQGRSRLTLFLAHSNLLIPQLSSVTVSVNGRALTSIPLLAADAIGARYDIEVPNSILRQDFNRMSLQFALSLGIECHDPLDPALWTTVLKESFQELGFAGDPPVPHQEPPRLDTYPYPFFRSGYPLAAPVTIVIPPDPLGDEIAAGYRLAADLSQRVTIEPKLLDVALASSLTPDVLASRQLIILGTPDRQPLLREVLPATTSLQEGATLPDGRKLAVTDGYLHISESPWNSALRVLSVTGAGMPAVLRGIDALTTPEASALLTGTDAVLVEPVNDNTRRDETSTGVTFAQRGIPDHTAVGLIDTSEVTFVAPVLAPSQHATLDLIVSTPDSLDRGRSNLVLELNDARVETVTLRNAQQQRASYRIELPGSQLRVGTNTMRIRTTLYPFEVGTNRICDSIAPERLWATYHRESAITFPSTAGLPPGRFSTLAELPEPFAGPIGLRETTFVITPERRASLRGGMSIALALARRGPTNDLRVILPHEAADKVGDRHLVTVGLAADSVVGKQLAGALPLAFGAGSVRALTERDALLAALAGSGPMAAIQIAPAPWGNGRGILAFDATDDTALVWATSAITRESLTGNVAVFRSATSITPLTIAWAGATGIPAADLRQAQLRALTAFAPVAGIALLLLAAWYLGPRLRRRRPSG